ncbi:MAG: glyoxalase/bleomycin resistance/dioxygenase family protein [Alphaproteobacteria bacterium]|nr:glyoxalase/bleomycin resistance/dioxygenase family protein [Alphaproteobacteria bacterium]
MKRLHVSLSVRDIEASIKFYTQLFASHPTVQREDYAKWLLDDPRVNFSIVGPTDAPGLSHLGIQVESSEELQEVHARMQATQGPVSDIADATCCYARGQKGWATDPQGVAWEGFFTHEDGLQHFGSASPVEMTPAVKEQAGQQKGCCG